jgi:hypothetical protein
VPACGQKEWRLEQEVSSGISPGTSWNERSMARFLESWYKLSELNECRGTMLIESMLVVTLLLYY